MVEHRIASNDKRITHVVNDLSTPPQTDFKSLASANFATPAAGPQWRDSSIGVYVGQGRCRRRKQPSPHYSRALLLQSRIRRCDKLGRMFHSAQAGGLAAQSVNILFKDAFLPRGLGPEACLTHSYKGPAPL